MLQIKDRSQIAEWVKFNQFHDKLGKFASGTGSAAAYTETPDWEQASNDWAYESINMNDALAGENLMDGPRFWGEGRKMTPEMAEELTQKASTIQSVALNYRTSENVLYRGESFKTRQDLEEKYPVGKRVVTSNLTSTAVQHFDAAVYMMAAGDTELSAQYPVKALVRVVNPRGNLAAPMYPMGKDWGAGEYVIAKGQSFKVDKVQLVRATGDMFQGNVPEGQEYFSITLVSGR